MPRISEHISKEKMGSRRGAEDAEVLRPPYGIRPIGRWMGRAASPSQAVMNANRYATTPPLFVIPAQAGIHRRYRFRSFAKARVHEFQLSQE